MPEPVIHVQRLYDTSDIGSGTRVLVDRLWPRGKKRDDPALGLWMPEVAPSTALRRDWHAGALSAAVCEARYRAELTARPEVLLPLLRLARQGPLTLLTAHRDPPHSHVPVLAQAVRDALEEEDRLLADREPSSPVCYAALGDERTGH